jgi:hypothetical protein
MGACTPETSNITKTNHGHIGHFGHHKRIVYKLK